MKNYFRSIIHLICLAFLVSCNAQKPVDKLESKPPNLVLILVDDMGYADVGFNGCQDIPTPNIDRIAEGGVKFTNGYVTYPVCGPSRAGLITGRYQGRFGFGRNPLFAPKDPGQGLPLTETTLAKTLNQSNYKSVALGKWHLGAHPSQRPLQRGFDDFYGFLTGGHRYFPEEWTLKDETEVTSQNAAYRTKLLRNDVRVEESEYLTDALSRETANYIEKYQDNPFFMYLAYNAPHAPLQATEKYLNRFQHLEGKRKTYAAMVSAVDDGVGLILDKLDELSLTEETIVVFLSDNGGPETRNGSDNGVLRGKKGDLTEGGIRVPFAMKWSGQIQPGTTYDHPISSLDIFGTIINQSVVKITPSKPIDGVDLMPFLRGHQKGAPHDVLFWRKFDDQHYAIRVGNEKIFGTREGEYQYDLENDIGETNALDINDEWVQLHKEWNTQMQDPVFLGLQANKKYNELHPERFTKEIHKK